MEWTKELDSRHSGAVLRLIDLLDDGESFCWILAEYNNQPYRDKVIAELAAEYPQQAILSATASTDLLAELPQIAQHASVIHLIDTHNWFDNQNPQSLLHRLNQRREWLAQTINRGIVVWLSETNVNNFAHDAPDLWAWRKAVVDFRNHSEDQPSHPLYSLRIDENNSDYADKQQRLIDISEYLQGKTDYSLADGGLWQEQARILASVGDYEKAIIAIKQGILISQANHDKRATAICYGDLADILHQTGDFNEALRIRREEELPVYEALGDKRSKAMTMGKIADVLYERGEWDEALSIYREEELPVYEALGDKREKAVTMGKIADDLQARGELDEALRIRREEELPVYEALGDKRSKAVTMGKIADVLQARGEGDEALRIRREEELPVYEALGDKRDLLVCQANLAMLLEAKDPNRYLSEIHQLLSQALLSAEQMNIPEQQVIRDILNKYNHS